MNNNSLKGKKGQVCQLLDPITQKKQWIFLDDIIIYPEGGGSYKLIDFLNKLNKRLETAETKIDRLELELSKTNEELLKEKNNTLMMLSKLNANDEILLKKYEALSNETKTLLSINNK